MLTFTGPPPNSPSSPKHLKGSLPHNYSPSSTQTPSMNLSNPVSVQNTALKQPLTKSPTTSSVQLTPDLLQFSSSSTSVQHWYYLPHTTPWPPGWHWDHWCCTPLVYIVPHWLPTLCANKGPQVWVFGYVTGCPPGVSLGSTPLHHLPPAPGHNPPSSWDPLSLLCRRHTSLHLLLTYKALHHLAPTYLCKLLHEYTPSRTLRSTSAGLLTIPTPHLSTMGARAFSCSAPRLWNSLLPTHKTDSNSNSKPTYLNWHTHSDWSLCTTLFFSFLFFSFSFYVNVSFNILWWYSVILCFYPM